MSHVVSVCRDPSLSHAYEPCGREVLGREDGPHEVTLRIAVEPSEVIDVHIDDGNLCVALQSKCAEHWFSLPPGVDVHRATADYRDGVLIVRVPRQMERRAPRHFR